MKVLKLTPILAFLLGSLLMIVPATADAIYEAGEILTQCGPFGCYQAAVRGVGAEIDMFPQTPALGMSLSYWISLDFNIGTQYHRWFQAGYIIGGPTPNGDTYSTPQIYEEYQSDSTYNFTIVKPTAFSSPHFFKVWTYPCPTGSATCANVMIDGTLVSQVTFGETEGSASAIAEVHGTALPLSQAGTLAHWSQLQFFFTGGFTASGCWQSWGTQPCGSVGPTASGYVVSQSTYYVSEVVSQTEFYVSWNQVTGGSGCGGCRLD